MAETGAASRAAERAEVAWSPHPGGQYLALTCPVWEMFLSGNRGGGKTDVALAKFLQGVGRGWGSYWRGIMFRRE